MKLLSKILVCSLFALLYFSSCKKDPPAEAPLASSISISNISSWNMASVPLRFAESNLTNNTACGFNRAKIAWYNIDPSVFYDKNLNRRPPNITKDDMSSDDCRVIFENELFPSKENQYNQPINLNVFNVDYYPSERGPWNFDASPSAYSAGISFEGYLNEPASRWGGILRKVEKTDRKINFLDFWILDPFSTYPEADGELVFDMGEISEDVLKDGFLSQENTILKDPVYTVWGIVNPLSLVNSFPADDYEFKFDTGLDELLSIDEETYFPKYLDEIKTICEPSVYNSIFADPSNDDFHSIRGKEMDQLNAKVLDRYKRFNENEKNSANWDDFPTVINSQRGPNSEDIDHNAILYTLNNYKEYKIHINKETLQVGSNYVVEIYTNPNPTKLENGSTTYSKFYHFRIPLEEYSDIYGSPDVSVNPESIRMYFTGFASPINLRFIQLMFTDDVYEYKH